MTPNRAMPRTMSIAAMRSAGAIGPAWEAASRWNWALADGTMALSFFAEPDTAPVVRGAWSDRAGIMKPLAVGAYATIVPLVNPAEEAAQGVAACRYPPVGMRSNGPVRAVQYGGADYVANANDEIVVMA